jgi:hypothetical protein
MSGVNEFLVELIRAANGVENVRLKERLRLVEEGITTIRRLQPPRTDKQIRRMDGVDRLHTRAIQAVTSCDDDSRDLLLEIAGTIRDLHIVLDTKTDVTFTEK